jgi:large subunit ribosomal protein L31
MQNSIHPEQHSTKIICTCGNKFDIVSSMSKKDMHIELCFKCHSAYTGKRKISTKGAVEQFENKFGAYTKAMANNKNKANDDTK